MPPTLGLVANVFNEANALPGWLETHLPHFDDVRVTHSGPCGEYSSDGTIEILEKYGIPISYDSIDDGFGAVRTRSIHRSPCDYVMLLDADERFYPLHHVLSCFGQSTPHEAQDDILRQYDPRDLNKEVPWEAIKGLGSGLEVRFMAVYDQIQYLRGILETKESPDAVVTVRRHWHDLSLRRPSQNWLVEPDWQMRVVRNHDTIGFDPSLRMHERLCGANKIHRADMDRGPFFDHFHFFFKKMEPGQRAHDVAVYDAIHAGNTPPTLAEFRKVKV
jgi:glycosyltransferase involved in cell wall biosynthesis